MRKKRVNVILLISFIMCIVLLITNVVFAVQISKISKKQNEIEQLLADQQEKIDALGAGGYAPETVKHETEKEMPENLNTETESEMDHTDNGFGIYEIQQNDSIYNRISERSYRENNDIALSDLRYVKVLHYDYDHEIQSGELIVHKDIADKVITIFTALYDNEYEIESVKLIDDYWIDGNTAAMADSNSIEHNNTSAFCYRNITGGEELSNHAFGCAIDINPLQNPYVYLNDAGEPDCVEISKDYINRDLPDSHIIREGDICWQIFTDNGFEWGGSWTEPIDYQHFEIVINR